MSRLATMLATCAALAATVAVVRDADAKCDFPRGYLSPAPGMPLPADPQLLLLGSDFPAALRVKGDGHALRFQSRRVGDKSWLIGVETDGERALTIAFDGREYLYPIDPNWRPALARIAGRVRIEDHWSCSFTDAIEVAIESNAIGFRADWTGAEPGSAFVPTFQDLAWHSEPEPSLIAGGPRGLELAASPRYAMVRLGHESCIDWNVPPKLYKAGGSVSLTALHADGSSEDLGLISLVAEPAVPPGNRVIDVGPLVQPREPPPSREPAPLPLDTDPRLPLGLALAGLLAALLLRRRRRPTLTR